MGYASEMNGWHVFQIIIFAGIVASNIHWQWTTGLAAGVMGGMAAYYLTGIAYGLLSGFRRLVRVGYTEHAPGQQLVLQPLRSRFSGRARQVPGTDRPTDIF